MSSKFEKHPRLTLFIFLTLAFLVLLIGFEKILGSKLTGGSSAEEVRHIRLREHAPFLQQTLHPSAKDLNSADTLTDKDYSFTTDKDGYIKPSQIYEHPDFTIAFLGGSTTECMFVDTDKRFPSLTGSLLEKQTGLKINTFNSGMAGNDTLHSINIFLNKVQFSKPDIAILMHNINDLSLLLHENTYWNNNEFRSPIVTEEQSLKTYVKQLLPNTFELLYRLKVSLLGYTDEFAEVRGNRLQLEPQKLLQMFKANLEIFVGIAKAKNIQAVLMTQANRFTEKPDKVIYKDWEPLKQLGISYEEYRNLYRSMNNTIRQVAQENNILLIDLAKAVPQNNQFMYDPVHLNNQGSERVAKLISEQLMDLIRNHRKN